MSVKKLKAKIEVEHEKIGAEEEKMRVNQERWHKDRMKAREMVKHIKLASDEERAEAMRQIEAEEAEQKLHPPTDL